MTLIDLLNKYLNKDIDAISTIRRLTSIFNPEAAIDILSLINSITRHEQGDIDTKTFRKVWDLDRDS